MISNQLAFAYSSFSQEWVNPVRVLLHGLFPSLFEGFKLHCWLPPNLHYIIHIQKQFSYLFKLEQVCIQMWTTRVSGCVTSARESTVCVWKKKEWKNKYKTNRQGWILAYEFYGKKRKEKQLRSRTFVKSTLFRVWKKITKF